MDILDDMGVSKLSAKVFSKVNYSFNIEHEREWVQCSQSCKWIALLKKHHLQAAKSHYTMWTI